MSVALSLCLRLSLRLSRGGSSCLGGIVVLNVVCVALLADVFFSVVGVDESLMSNEEVTSGECLGTDVANEWLLFCVCTNVALQMF